MQLKCDSEKGEGNLGTHGIDFETAQALRDGSTVEFKANAKGENRSKVLGRIAGEYWAAIVTMRGKRTRIISVRKATPRERSTDDRYIND